MKDGYKICLFGILLILIAHSLHAQKPYRKMVVDTVPWTVKRQNIQPLPSNQYVQHLSFFCKKEWQLEKTIKVPLRFRLGTIEVADRLEGKRKY